MEGLMYQTNVFKDIFEDYDSFKEWYLDCGLSEDEDDVPSQITFQLIYNEYADSHSAFSDDDFKLHFANDIYTYYREFEATTKSIKELMALTDDEVTNAGTTVLNIADVPETASSTDADTVNYISNQQKTLQNKGLMQVKREQLSNKRTFTVKTFLNRFRHLFIKIISPAYVYVIGETTED